MWQIYAQKKVVSLCGNDLYIHLSDDYSPSLFT